jgi:sulfate permease, SulP family
MFVPKSIVCLKDYSLKKFQSDLVAGLIVGLVALPLAMAFAIASGLPPERGIYTAVVAGFLISALGGSRVSIGGPTGAFVIIVAGIVAKFGYEGLAIATGMAGVVLILMGLMRLGTLIQYIPYPVTTGFTTGIAVVIFSTQIKDFFGLSLPVVPSDFMEKWGAYVQSLPTFSVYALGIGLFTILLIGFWPRQWTIPGPLIALVLTSLAAAWGHWPVETIGTRFGIIPQGLPQPHMVFGSWSQIKLLLPSAFTIAMLAAIESLLCAVVADGMIGGKHKPNMELVAQGIANCISPLFGGMPATGAIARTAVNVKNGGRTPMAGMIHALVLFIILLTAGPLAARIPLAALAGVLIVVAYHMSEWRSVRFIFTGTRSDIAVLLTTFLLTVLVDLTVAVSVGMVLAAFLFMRQMAEVTQVRSLTRENDKEFLAGLEIPRDVEIYAINGSFFFGAAKKIMEIENSLFKKPSYLILEMSGVLHLDTSGLRVLEHIHQQCIDRKTRLILAGIHAQPLMVLQKAGKYEALGADNFKSNLKEALDELN